MAKLLKHAKTAVKCYGNEPRPCRIGVVVYQPRQLNLPLHGKFEAEKRAEKKLKKLVTIYHEGKQLGKNQLKIVEIFLATFESKILI